MAVIASQRSLEDRFKAFLAQLDGAESIDDSLSESELASGKRADFLLNGRRIVLEIKSIETDPEYKVEERLSPHRERPEFPAFYWNAELTEVLSYLPDGEKIRREIAHAVTRSVQGALEKADEQIGTTKSALRIDTACGVVAILNESVGILAPDLLTATAAQVLSKTRNGVIRYKNIAYAWIIAETHRVGTAEPTEYLPLVLWEGPTAHAYVDAGRYLDALQRDWARFDGMPVVSAGPRTTFDDLDFQKRTRPESTSGPLARHEWWRKTYRANPYLRSLSEEEFLQYGVRILSTMTPHFLVGHQKLPTAQVAELMQRWTHILEEAEYRRLDMKKLRARWSP
ncbi:MAG: hypothetical protein ACJ8NR_11065 [Sulfurifustis sp.]